MSSFRALCFIGIGFAFLGIVRSGSKQLTVEERIGTVELAVNQLSMSVSRILKHLKMEEVEDKPFLPDTAIVPGFLNDTDLEERVTVLESQMSNVQDVAAIEETVTGLQANDENQQGAINSLDFRLSQVELDGAVAFHTYLGIYSTIPPGTVVVMPNVLVNLGNGFNSETGTFTVPTGGAGLYYLYAHFMYDIGDWVYIGIRRNGFTLCYATNDDLQEAQDHDASSCGAVSVLDEGRKTFSTPCRKTNKF